MNASDLSCKKCGEIVKSDHLYCRACGALVGENYDDAPPSFDIAPSSYDIAPPSVGVVATATHTSRIAPTIPTSTIISPPQPQKMDRYGTQPRVISGREAAGKTFQLIGNDGVNDGISVGTECDCCLPVPPFIGGCDNG